MLFATMYYKFGYLPFDNLKRQPDYTRIECTDASYQDQSSICLNLKNDVATKKNIDGVSARVHQEQPTQMLTQMSVQMSTQMPTEITHPRR
jgi:hypothetical protein